jgi:hypothetical protein
MRREVNDAFHLLVSFSHPLLKVKRNDIGLTAKAADRTDLNQENKTGGAPIESRRR